MFTYPARYERADDGVTVTFPDFPEAVTCGGDESEAYAMAAEALMLAVGERLRNREAIPEPDPAPADALIALPSLLALKAGLWQAMRAHGVSIAELARRLEMQPLQVRRLLDPDHASRAELIDRALAELGSKATVGVTDASALKHPEAADV